jgi:hypothetical protein
MIMMIIIIIITIWIHDTTGSGGAGFDISVKGDQMRGECGSH